MYYNFLSKALSLYPVTVLVGGFLFAALIVLRYTLGA